MYILGNSLIKIKNALMAGKNVVVINYTNLNQAVVEVLISNGYVKDKKIFKEGKFKYIELQLEPENGRLNEIKLISKPSRRIYMSVNDLKGYKTKLGTLVVSTPKGVLDKNTAIKNGVGGEVLFKVF